MDGEHFDELAKRLTQTSLSRWAALRGLVASAVVGLTGASLTEATAARKKVKGASQKHQGKRDRTHGKGKHKGKHKGKNVHGQAKPPVAGTCPGGRCDKDDARCRTAATGCVCVGSGNKSRCARPTTTTAAPTTTTTPGVTTTTTTIAPTTTTTQLVTTTTAEVTTTTAQATTTTPCLVIGCSPPLVANFATCRCDCPQGTTTCQTTTAGTQCCSDATQYCGRYGSGVAGCLEKVCNEFGAGICAGGGGTCAGDPLNPNSACACGRTAEGGQACLAASECQTGSTCETNADCAEGTVCAVTGTGQQATGPNRCVRVCQLTPV